jgi:hypothetical protein
VTLEWLFEDQSPERAQFICSLFIEKHETLDIPKIAPFQDCGYSLPVGLLIKLSRVFFCTATCTTPFQGLIDMMVTRLLP